MLLQHRIQKSRGNGHRESTPYHPRTKNRQLEGLVSLLRESEKVGKLLIDFPLVSKGRQCPIGIPSHFRDAIHVLATAQVAGSLVTYQNLSIPLPLQESEGVSEGVAWRRLLQDLFPMRPAVRASSFQCISFSRQGIHGYTSLGVRFSQCGHALLIAFLIRAFPYQKE